MRIETAEQLTKPSVKFIPAIDILLRQIDLTTDLQTDRRIERLCTVFLYKSVCMKRFLSCLSIGVFDKLLETFFYVFL